MDNFNIGKLGFKLMEGVKKWGKAVSLTAWVDKVDIDHAIY